jgi:hypothetical protein
VWVGRGRVSGRVIPILHAQVADFIVRTIALAAHASEVCTHTLEIPAQGKNLAAQGVVVLT